MLRGSELPRAQGRRVDPQLRPRESGIAAPIHRSAWKVNSRKPTKGTYPYGMGRPRDDRDLARELADLAAQLASLKGEANA
jgi:hypothetical protein